MNLYKLRDGVIIKSNFKSYIFFDRSKNDQITFRYGNLIIDAVQGSFLFLPFNKYEQNNTRYRKKIKKKKRKKETHGKHKGKDFNGSTKVQAPFKPPCRAKT